MKLPSLAPKSDLISAKFALVGVESAVLVREDYTV